MKKIKNLTALVLSLVLCFLVCGVCFASQENLASNGDFEENIYYWDLKKASMTHVLGDGASGNGCAMVKVLEPAGRPRYAFNFKPGITYDISVWVRLQSGTDKVRFLISHDELFGLKVATTSSKDVEVGTTWTEIKTSYTFNGEENMGWAWIAVQWGAGKTTPTYYIDNLRITERNAVSEESVREDELCKNSGLSNTNEGYVVKGATLEIVKEDTYKNSNGSGKVVVSENGGYVAQQLTLVPGKSYIFSASVKTKKEVLPFKCFLDITGSNSLTSKSVVREMSGEGTSIWSNISTMFTVPEGGEETTVLCGLVAGNGNKNITYFIDDFSIVEMNVNESTQPVDGVDETAVEIENKKTLFLSLDENFKIYDASFIDAENSPYITQGEIMCDAKEFADIFGLEYSENGEEIVIGKNKDKAYLRLGRKLFVKDSIVHPLNVAPLRTNSSVFIPLSVITECAGFNLEYDEALKVVKIEG